MLEARILAAHALGVERVWISAHEKDEPGANGLRDIEALYSRRRAGEPIAYLTGEREFYGLSLAITSAVLIPRPETELLVDEVLHNLNKFDETVSILDLGAGSGAIGIALQTETAGKKKVAVIAVENSVEALPWLHKNIAKYDLPIRVVEESVVSALMGVKCDIVVANPPYIPNEQILPHDVLNEPAAALLGGPDGMDVPRLFIQAASRLLKSGGMLALEHHETQGNLIKSALELEFTNIRLHNDLNDRPRFTTAFRK